MVTSIMAKISEPRCAEESTPVFLVGFMGSGKTSIGKLLALECERTFVDIDAELESLFRMPIHRLFSEGREVEFRKAESESIIRHSGSAENSIIATGGGACEDQGALRAMRDNGIVFWLDAPWPVLQARIAGDSRRPMLARDPEALYHSRLGSYAACAHYRVDASASPEKIAEEIFKLI